MDKYNKQLDDLYLRMCDWIDAKHEVITRLRLLKSTGMLFFTPSDQDELTLLRLRQADKRYWLGIDEFKRIQKLSEKKRLTNKYNENI